MAGVARNVVPGMAHRVTQRGNRRMETFFCEDDYRAYLALLVEWCRRTGQAGLSNGDTRHRPS
jgi:putative transposase